MAISRVRRWWLLVPVVLLVAAALAVQPVVDWQTRKFLAIGHPPTPFASGPGVRCRGRRCSGRSLSLKGRRHAESLGLRISHGSSTSIVRSTESAIARMSSSGTKRPVPCCWLPYWER